MNNNCDDLQLKQAEKNDDNDHYIYYSDNMSADGIHADTSSSEQEQLPESEEQQAKDGIAIIGMSGFFPGSESIDDFCNKLENQHSFFHNVPDNHDPAPSIKDRFGAFLNEIACFDPEVFNIGPMEALYMDPRQRLLLMSVWHTLEDACYLPSHFNDSVVDVFIGSEVSAYAPYLAKADVTAYSALGIASWALANRISHAFKFKGKSLCIDTACAGGSTALHTAVQSLRNNEAEYAVAGSAHLLYGDGISGAYVAQEAMGILDNLECCYPFQQNATGFLPAEGVVTVLLKKLSSAIRDKDNIHGIILGSHVNHTGGYGSAITMPSAASLSDAIVAAYQHAGIDPSTVAYIEAHGGSSSLIDAEEIKSFKIADKKLTQQFGRKIESSCKISTIKANLGHANAASGFLSLVRAIHSLKIKKKLGIRSFSSCSDKINLQKTRFYINDKTEPWEAYTDKNGKELPRRVAINNLGAGGVNAHILLEEYKPTENMADHDALSAGKDKVYFLALSTLYKDQLLQYANNIVGFLEKNKTVHPEQLEYIYAVSRKSMKFRLVFRYKNIDELKGKLNKYTESGGERGYYLRNDCDRNDDANEIFYKHKKLSEFVHSLKQEHDKSMLFELWVKGLETPMESYFEEKPIIKQSFPCYPFKMENFWVELSEKGDSSPAQVESITKTPSESKQDESSLVSFISSRVLEIIGGSESKLQSGQALQQLGMNSIGIVTLKYLLEKQLQIQVPVQLLSSHQTFTELCQAIKSLSADVIPVNSDGLTDNNISTQQSQLMYPEIVPAPEDAYQAFPLNDLQSGILAGRRLKIDGDWVGCHLYFEFECKDLDCYRLNQAWQRLIDYHPMLRVTILDTGEQRISSENRFYKFNMYDFSNDSESKLEEKLLRLRKRMSHKVYKMNQWPLFDICIVLIKNNKSLVFFSMDEMLIDAHSLGILVSQWQNLYFDLSIELPELHVSFRDYLIAKQKFEHTDSFKKILQMQMQRTGTLPSGPQLPLSGQQYSSNERYLREQLVFSLDADAWQRMKQKSSEWGIFASSLLLGLFSEVLRAHSDEDRFAMVITFFNRPPLHPQINEIVGQFVSTQILVMESLADKSFQESLLQTDGILKQTLDCNQVSGIRLLRELRSQKRVAQDVIFPVSFTSLLNIDGTSYDPALGDDEKGLFKPRYAISQTPQVYLDHQVHEQQDGGLYFTWDIVAGVYVDGLLKTLFDQYCRLLVALGSEDCEWDWSTYNEIIQSTGLNPTVNVTPLTKDNQSQSGKDKENDSVNNHPHIEIQALPQDRYKPFPLTVFQHAMGFSRSQYLKNESDSAQLYCEINLNKADITGLQFAWQKILQRHEILHTIVYPNGQQQCLEQVPEYIIESVDFSQLDEKQRDEALVVIKESMMANITPLGEWPYFSIKVSCLPDDAAKIHFTIDMIIADGSSIQTVIKEWLILYHVPETVLEPLQVTFRDYVMALETYKQSEAYHADIKYWKNKFKNFVGGPVLPKRKMPREKIRRQRFSAVFSQWNQLYARAESLSLPVEIVLLAAYMEILSKATGNKAFEIVVPYWDRISAHSQIEKIVGEFSAMSWVAADLNDICFVDKCRNYLAVRKEDACHRIVNGITELRTRRNQDRQLLNYPIVFSLPLPTDDEVDEILSEFTISDMESQTGGVEIDNITDIASDYAVLHWDVAINVFDEGLIEGLFNDYQNFLSKLLECEEGWNFNAAELEFNEC